MATVTVTPGYNWVSGEVVTPAKMNLAAGPTVTAAVADGEVTNVKLATGIDASKLTTGTLPIARIADDAVTNDKLSLAANAGEIKKALNADNNPPIFACRAWVNFDGTKDTTGAASAANTNRLIRASGNVTSVLRNGAGDYTVTFTTAMPDANYCATLGWTNTGPTTSFDGSASVYSAATVTAASVRVFASQGVTSGMGEEAEYFAVAIFR
jgi:molybdopterin-binding protein